MRRRRRLTVRLPVRRFVPLPPVEPASVERAVEEGLLIARSALVMDVKNHIIVAAIRDGIDFDETALADFVRAEVHKLAREHSGYEEQTKLWATAAVTARGPHADVHDYRSGDLDALTHREETYSGMAAGLDALAHDSAYVAGILESARLRAWEELAAVIGSTLDRMAAVSTEEDYERHRGTRLRQFRAIDLAQLIESRSHTY